eukprot:5694571-Alexandrium_andersonii.AAC.3
MTIVQGLHRPSKHDSSGGRRLLSDALAALATSSACPHVHLRSVSAVEVERSRRPRIARGACATTACPPPGKARTHCTEARWGPLACTSQLAHGPAVSARVGSVERTQHGRQQVHTASCGISGSARERSARFLAHSGTVDHV